MIIMIKPLRRLFSSSPTTQYMRVQFCKREKQLQVVSSQRIKAAERIIGPRTGFDYQFDVQPDNKVKVFGTDLKTHSETSVMVAL
jgi:hypothetical protein